MLRKGATVDTLGTKRKCTEDVRHLTDIQSVSFIKQQSESTLLAKCINAYKEFDSICQDVYKDLQLNKDNKVKQR